MTSRHEAAATALAMSLAIGILPALSHAQSNTCPVIEGHRPASLRLTHPAAKPIRAAEPQFKTLREFSGLAVVPDGSSPDGFSLWTIDDGEPLLIRLSSAGEIAETVKVQGADDLEEIAYDPEKQRLAVVSEQSGRVRFFKQESGGFQETGGFTLAELSGYDGKDAQDVSGNTLQAYYENDTAIEEAKGKRPNSGWEGMTFTGDGRMYFVKEKNPAILIEVRLNEADLHKSTITDIVMLNCGSRKKRRLCPETKPGASLPFSDKVEVGDQDDEHDDKVLDFSGLAYDAASKKLWMTSDQGQAAILFDPKTRTFSAFPLIDDARRCLPHAEGIALSVDGAKLFVINDEKRQEDSTLLTYDIAR